MTLSARSTCSNAHEGVAEFGGGVGACVQLWPGSEFDDVEAEDVSAFGGGFTGVEGLPPCESAGLRSACGSHQGGIEAINIKGEVNVFGEIRREELAGDAVVCDLAGVKMADIVGGTVVDFLFAEVADADLENGEVDSVPLHVPLQIAQKGAFSCILAVFDKNPVPLGSGLEPLKTKGSEVNPSLKKMVQEEGLEPPTASV